MPATATGRGAQVVIDPASDHAKAIRGAYANTLELNTAKVRADRLSGAVASGDTTSDGTTSTGGRATDEAMAPAGAGQARTLSPPVASVGNGADTTQDTLQTFIVPANTLRNVGDRLRIVAAGTMAATTDNRTARTCLNATANVYAASAATAASVTSWRHELDIVKTGSNTQTLISLASLVNAQTVTSAAPTLTDTAAITVIVTGQNTTTAAANSIICNYLTVEFIPASV